MNKFLKWVKGFGFKIVINLLKNKTDWMAKKMADSVDIPFVSEKNEQKEAKKAVEAIVGLIEELADKETKK